MPQACYQWQLLSYNGSSIIKMTIIIAAHVPGPWIIRPPPVRLYKTDLSHVYHVSASALSIIYCLFKVHPVTRLYIYVA